MTFRIQVQAPQESAEVRLWIPYPVTEEFQEIKGIDIKGNQSYQSIFTDSSTGNMALYAQWSERAEERYILFSFEVSALRRVKRDFAVVEAPLPLEVREYLRGTRFIPVDGRVKEIADKIVLGKTTVLERARAVYDWVVENTHRDEGVQGCGIGDVEVLLTKKAGGKCVDISSVFVALARAGGVPAREVFGLRLGKQGQSDITKAHHCWAEFYQPGYGWVPVDPADVRKVIFEKNLTLKEAKPYRDYYFGALDEYRIVLGRGGRELYLNPKIDDGPLNYFMYPYAEVDGKAVDWLAAQKELKYEITFKAGE
ncbi:MAG: transglutaminase domain-containing protein [Proteobacteria bacterium]|nr:transglutaminase domain-containing protein [Pseudomonadota bacterium]